MEEIKRTVIAVKSKAYIAKELFIIILVLLLTVFLWILFTYSQYIWALLFGFAFLTLAIVKFCVAANTLFRPITVIKHLDDSIIINYPWERK